MYRSLGSHTLLVYFVNFGGSNQQIREYQYQLGTAKLANVCEYFQLPANSATTITP